MQARCVLIERCVMTPSRTSDLQSAEEIIASLGLTPHPEGGWYAETFRDDAG
ncbi:MAG: cupin domain-containing protein, partial [Paracoccus sp. (in: a-proteobacteria)]